MRLTRRGLAVLATAVVLVMSVSPNDSDAMNLDPYIPPPATPQEDELGWDCRTMGNRYCAASLRKTLDECDSEFTEDSTRHACWEGAYAHLHFSRTDTADATPQAFR